MFLGGVGDGGGDCVCGTGVCGCCIFRGGVCLGLCGTGVFFWRGGGLCWGCGVARTIRGVCVYGGGSRVTAQRGRRRLSVVYFDILYVLMPLAYSLWFMRVKAP